LGAEFFSLYIICGERNARVTDVSVFLICSQIRILGELPWSAVGGRGETPHILSLDPRHPGGRRRLPSIVT
jgi:hypothetical protein